MIEYVSQSGFLIPSELCCVRLDWHLLTVLIERWRTGTSSFYLREGEMNVTLQNVTLQNVAVLLRLRINGSPATGTDERDWAEECNRLLGMVCTPMAMHDGQVKLIWYHEQFTVPPTTYMQDQQHAHTYIFHMIITQLFSDYSKNKVYIRWLPLLEDFNVCDTMLWNSVVLDYLYSSFLLSFYDADLTV